MPHIEVPRFIRRGNQKDALVLDVSDSINQITTDALNILVKGKGSPEAKIKNYRKKAEKLLELIASKLLEDPNFYKQLDPDVNMKTLQLLSELVPKQRSEEFQSSPNNRVIAGYLKDLGRYNGIISLEQNEGDSTSIYSDSAVRRIRSGSRMPKYFLDNIFGENVGRPPERVKRGNNGVISLDHYREVVKAPGEHRNSRNP